MACAARSFALRRPETLIFGGGGIKCVAYLGALEAVSALEPWHEWSSSLRTLAGASAGALCAVCMSLGLSLPRVQDVLEMFDNNVLFEGDLVGTLLRGLDTVLSAPSFGVIPVERMQTMYELILENLGLERGATLGELEARTRRAVHIYVTNMTARRIERWCAATHPNVPVAFALAASSAIPFVVTQPLVGAHMYSDGGMMMNVPLSAHYDPRSSLALMLVTDSREREPVPSWIGQYASRIMDVVFEAQRNPVFIADPHWQLSLVRIETQSLTLMDTFSTTKLGADKIDRAKRDGRAAMREWLARRTVLAWIVVGGALGHLARDELDGQSQDGQSQDEGHE